MSDTATLQARLGHLAAGGDRPAILAFGAEGAATVTYAELAHRAGRIAGGLRAHGIAPGHYVGIHAPNSPDWIAARIAVLLAGAVAVSLDNDLTAEQLGHQLADAQARAILTVRGHLDMLAAAGAADTPVWLFDAAPDDPRAISNLDGEPPPLPDPSGDDTATLFYTSGTTGRPKGVPLTHRNITSNLDALLAQNLLGAGDRVLLPLPLHHSYPFIVGMLMPLVTGATIVLPRDVSGPEIRRALSEGEVAIVVGVPRLYQALANGLTQRLREGGASERVLYRVLRLSASLRRRFGVRWGRTLLWPLHKRLAPKLRLMASGGAKLDADTAWTLEGFGWMVLSGYGLVETASISTFNPPGRARLGSAGLPAPGVRVTIAGPDAEGTGEVRIQGPNVFPGYLNRPDANAEAFDAEGAFRTGDLGRFDADGYLHIVGRAKEMIVLPDGKNIAPETVERVYAQSPYIHEIAVLEDDGRLVGLIVPDLTAVPGAGANIGDVIRVSLQELGAKLPPHERLSDWAITREELPRTHLGKYRRHLLPPILARAQRGERTAATEPTSDADRALLAEPTVKRVFDWLDARFPNHSVGLNTSPQLDLGVDSLAWVEMGFELEEKFGVALSEEAVAQAVTVRELLQTVRDAAPAREGGRRREAAREAERWLHPQSRGERIAAALAHGTLKALCGGLFRLRVEGPERLPASGPAILAPNHVSDLDAFVFTAALPGRLRGHLAWGADRDRLFGTRLRRTAARLAGLFPVDDRAPGASLAAAEAALNQNRILVWFPEEWRSPDGRLQPFRPGVGRLLQDRDIPVVPCAILGTFAAMPRGARLPKPTAVTVRFGEPVSAATLAAEAGSRDPDALATALRERVAALLPGERG
ncbi:long-chain acyl-CoA synthetase [Limimonas halophila]|uniref:Long-chain acyl-CoA synthetase n=1 Tax=Limimonas halophila TaxID=1082479 RepID=A0A1G7MHM6_9PROT|nr:AMP-binding protein [Limimonas halophila]SDF60620.1 long-chain acyl-CoA synthetase [Limimonas halophila]